MYRFSVITFLTLLSIAGFTLTVAGPINNLGEEGVHIWTPSGVSDLAFHSISDGDQVLSIWSNINPETALRTLYLQETTSNGEKTFNPPLILSDPDQYITGREAEADNDGNLFVAWFTHDDDANPNSRCVVQKINSEGDLLWGENGRTLITYNIENVSWNNVRLIVLSDFRGGVYVYLKWINTLFALNSDGEIRNDWRLDDELPINGELKSMVADGLGGFWAEIEWVIGDIGEDLGLNRFSYTGEILWEQHQYPFGNNIPEDEAIVRAGINGGGLCVINQDEGSLIFRIDSSGQYMGEDYTFEFEEQNGTRNSIFRYVFQHSDNSIWFCIRESDEEYQRFFITKYEPENNEIPWNDQKILIAEWENEINGNQVRTTPKFGWENSNGNVTFSIHVMSSDFDNTYLYQITPNGELLNDDPINLGGMMLRNGAAGPEETFYISGKVRVPSETMAGADVILLSEDGEAQFEEPVSIFGYRRQLHVRSIWRRPNGNYKVLMGGDRKIRAITLDPAGDFIGDPLGETVIDSIPDDASGIAIQAGSRFVNIWYIRDGSIPVLSIINHLGELETTFTFDEDRAWHRDIKNIGYDPVSGLVILKLTFVTPAHLYPVLFGIDPMEEEIVWSIEMDAIYFANPDNYRMYTRFLFDDQGFYVLTDHRDRRISILKFNYEGEQLWDESIAYRSFVDHRIEGAILNGNDEILVVKRTRIHAEEFTWTSIYSGEGDVVADSLPVYADPDTSVYSGIKVVDGIDGFWVLPPAGSNMGVQRIDAQGDRLLGDNGLSVGDENNGVVGSMSGVADGDGGIWLIWMQVDEVFHRGNFYNSHLDEEGEPHDGWTFDGEPAYGDMRGNVYISYFSGLDPGFCSVVMDYSKNGYVLNGGGWSLKLQHISDGELESSSSLSPYPSSFILFPTYPNPFNNSTVISYSLPIAGKATLNVFDLHGRRVETLFDAKQSAGSYNTVWSPRGLPSGLYFVRLEAGLDALSQKVMLIK